LFIFEKKQKMLTIQIDDVSLEQRIYSKAKDFGTTSQQFVKDLLRKSLDEENSELGFPIPHLDYRQHIKTINFGITDHTLSKETVPLFSDIGDSGEYVHKMRREKRP
jgi:CO dehydrogenase/acetyl-CoA synthase gamma subunit (corrinoid Fe-S protein)